MKWNIKNFNELTTIELYNILKVRTNVFVVEQNCPYAECDDKDINSIHLFATKDSNVIAYLRILLPGISYKESSICRVLVHKDYRHSGIAKEMMAKAITYIDTYLEEKTIRISAQQYLIDFYKSFGFKECSEGYLEDGIPHIEMLYDRSE